MTKLDIILSEAKSRGMALVGQPRRVFATDDAPRFASRLFLARQMTEIGGFMIR
jgi:hypothetical protein